MEHPAKAWVCGFLNYMSPVPGTGGQSRAARTGRGVQQRRVRLAQLQQLLVRLVQQEVQEVGRILLLAPRRARRRRRARLVAGLACAPCYTLKPRTKTLGFAACELSLHWTQGAIFFATQSKLLRLGRCHNRQVHAHYTSGIPQVRPFSSSDWPARPEQAPWAPGLTKCHTYAMLQHAGTTSDRAAPLDEASSGPLAGLKRLTVGNSMSGSSACPPSSAAHVAPGACCEARKVFTDLMG